MNEDDSPHERFTRSKEALRLLYKAKGMTDLTDDELAYLVEVQDRRIALAVRVAATLIVLGLVVYLFAHFLL